MANGQCYAMWEILLISGADVSRYAHETRTHEGRISGYWEWYRHGSVAEVVEAVRQLREDYDEACRELHG